MLILARNIGESLMIGDRVVVKVMGIKGEQVRLGVQAPRDVAVHREEIYERIHAPVPRRAGQLQAQAPQIQMRRHRPHGSAGE